MCGRTRGPARRRRRRRRTTRSRRSSSECARARRPRPRGASRRLFARRATPIRAGVRAARRLVRLLGGHARGSLRPSARSGAVRSARRVVLFMFGLVIVVRARPRHARLVSSRLRALSGPRVRRPRPRSRWFALRCRATTSRSPRSLRRAAWHLLRRPRLPRLPRATARPRRPPRCAARLRLLGALQPLERRLEHGDCHPAQRRRAADRSILAAGLRALLSGGGRLLLRALARVRRALRSVGLLCLVRRPCDPLRRLLASDFTVPSSAPAAAPASTSFAVVLVLPPSCSPLFELDSSCIDCCSSLGWGCSLVRFAAAPRRSSRALALLCR